MSDRIQEEAVVRYIKDGYAYLEATGSSSCGSCSSKGACSSASLIPTSANSTLRIENNDNLKAGDNVMIEMSSERLLLGTLLVYILPLVSLFVMAIAGKYFGGEIASIVMGGVGLLLGFLIAKRILAKKEVAHQFDLNVERK